MKHRLSILSMSNGANNISRVAILLQCSLMAKLKKLTLKQFFSTKGERMTPGKGQYEERKGEEKGRESVTMEPVGMNVQLAEECEKAYDAKVSSVTTNREISLRSEGARGK